LRNGRVSADPIPDCAPAIQKSRRLTSAWFLSGARK
jgi:hypothetical protein